MKIGNDWPLPISSAPRGRDGCSRQTVSRDRHEDIGSNSHDDQFCVNVLWICLISSEITHTHTPHGSPPSHACALTKALSCAAEAIAANQCLGSWRCFVPWVYPITRAQWMMLSLQAFLTKKTVKVQC